MNGRSPLSAPAVTGMSAASAVLLWMSQPPFAAWPLVLVALVPWLILASDHEKLTRRDCLIIWAFASFYWLVSLQGLRHANPLMYFCWIALAGYLGVYPLLFVCSLRRLLDWRLPTIVAVPVAWVGIECIRNYLLTGISAAMLGHTMADVASMVQIADLLGTYGVSFVIAVVNVAAFELLRCFRKQIVPAKLVLPFACTAAVVGATLAYGQYRLNEPLGEPLARFALVQRSEEVEYGQGIEREVEIFENYAEQSKRFLKVADAPVDAVVWPESMFTGGAPRMTADADAQVPPSIEIPRSEFLQNVRDHGEMYSQRAFRVQALLAAAQRSAEYPELIAGCGVVHYGRRPEVYSGIVHITDRGHVADWYGKTHLVMFGEYVPIIPSIPLLNSLVPPGLGLSTGPGAKCMMVGSTKVAPNICIETAVERVTVNQIAELRDAGTEADVVVTVTNDGWFDDSSVIDHHLRCAQLVAVGCRKPVLSAANNGPTAWVDSCGRVVQRLGTGTNGGIIAVPERDPRLSVYVRIGDWPARILALIVTIGLVAPLVNRRQQTNEAEVSTESTETNSPHDG